MTLAQIFASNLRGKDYIAARGLTPAMVRDQQHECSACKAAEKLPDVLRLLKKWEAP